MEATEWQRQDEQNITLRTAEEYYNRPDKQSKILERVDIQI